MLSIMPSVLGFSLGGYAMWIALGDENFRKLITVTTQDGKASPFMSVNAAFVENSLILTTFGKYFFYICKLGAFLGYFVFIYALLSAMAATLALLRVSSWYDAFMNKK